MSAFIDPLLRKFVAESNRIEGITREPSSWEVTAHDELLKLGQIKVADLKEFVGAIQPGARIRTEYGMNVRVGNHLPIPGGIAVHALLADLLADANRNARSPYDVHRDYETLHPFMDGNGRSGRALWAWHMLRVGEDPFALPFLHRWYYQSLDAGRSA